MAGCFPRRETRQSCGQMVSGLLMELDDHNCWTIAEAAGHRGPHRLQHLLSRAVWDDQRVLDIASAWAAGHLDDGDAVLIMDETADEKSSGTAVGAARQYTGTVGGIALCQVAVILTYATGRGHALIGRALYLPEGCAADEEHRELAGVPEEVMFATKRELARALLRRARQRGDPRRLRDRRRSSTADATYAGRSAPWAWGTCWQCAKKITSSPSRAPAWTPGRSSAGSPGTAGPRSACSPTSTSPSPSPCSASKRPAKPDAGLVPITVPEWCGCCAASSSHRPGETGPTGCTGRTGADATSTAPAKPTSAGTPAPRQHHDHNELQLP